MQLNEQYSPLFLSLGKQFKLSAAKVVLGRKPS